MLEVFLHQMKEGGTKDEKDLSREQDTQLSNVGMRRGGGILLEMGQAQCRREKKMRGRGWYGRKFHGGGRIF